MEAFDGETRGIRDCGKCGNCDSENHDLINPGCAEATAHIQSTDEQNTNQLFFIRDKSVVFHQPTRLNQIAECTATEQFAGNAPVWNELKPSPSSNIHPDNGTTCPPQIGDPDVISTRKHLQLTVNII